MKLSHTYRTMKTIWFINKIYTNCNHVTVHFQSYSTEVKKDIDLGEVVMMVKFKGIHISSIFFNWGHSYKISYKAFLNDLSLTGSADSLPDFPASCKNSLNIQKWKCCLRKVFLLQL